MAKNQKIWIVAGVMIIFAVFVGWQIYKSRQTSGTIKIGGAFALTGDAAAYGEAEMNATELAIGEINKNGGVHGKPLQLIIEDTGSDDVKTVSAITKLLSINKVSGVIESWADAYGGANPLYEQYNIVMISPSASITALQSSKFYENIFSTYFRSDMEMQQLADDLASQGKKKIGIIMQNDPYWLDVTNRFVAEAQKDGLKVVENYTFNNGDTDFHLEWAKLKAEQPDAILFGANGDQETYPLLKQRAEIYPDAPLYTDEYIEEYLSEAQYSGLFHGLTYIYPRQLVNQSSTFATDYEAQFGAPPPLDASNAYDAMMILAQAFIHAGLGGDDIRAYIHQNAFNTVTFGDNIRFDNLGGIIETGFELANVK